MRNRDGFLFVYSVIDKASYQTLENFYNQLISTYETHVPPVVLIANKSDVSMDERQLLGHDGKELAKKFNAQFIETSAKTGHNVEQAFILLVREMRKNALAK